MSWLLVALGGAGGALLRAFAVLTFAAPWATMAINIIGSFLIGICFILLPARGLAPSLVMGGFLGGFTTFSAFSLDTLKLWQSGRVLEASLYCGGSVILSLAAVALGVTIARGLA